MGRPKEAVGQPDNGKKFYNGRLGFKGNSQNLEQHQRTSPDVAPQTGTQEILRQRESALGARQQFMCSFSIISGRAILMLALETQKGPVFASFC